MRFADRREAGRQLAARFDRRDWTDPIVLALPRGGVPVAFELAARIGAQLEVFVARKIGAPGHTELGIGAIAEGWDGLVITPTARAIGFGQGELEMLAGRERQELERRVEDYRKGRPLPALSGRDVILVDDGLATGVTAQAALGALRAHEPRRLVLAVPVCPPDTAAQLARIADDVVCVAAPPDFHAVGLWYEDFSQTTDAEVVELLERARSAPAFGEG